MEFEPAGERTRAMLTVDVVAAGFPWALLDPLIRTAVRRADAGRFGAFRQVVESGVR